MKKELLNERNKQQLINRVNTLQPDAKCEWGKMTVNEMMFHCAKVNIEILKSRQPDNQPTLKQTIIKILVLRLFKALPKGVKSNPKYFKAANDNLNFDIERNKLVETINRFADYKDSIFGNHPFFGPLNTAEWRRFVWMHLDHHLRQFSV